MISVQKQKKKEEAAYTLIEILVAITIIGILFSIGYANFRAFSRRQAVLDATKSIQGDLRLTQEKALAGQKPDDISCTGLGNSLSGYNFEIISSTSYEIRAKCSGGNVSNATKVVDLGVGLSFASPLPSPNPILFKVLGHGTNIDLGQSASINIIQQGTNNSAGIIVTSGGQIQ